MVAIQRVEYDAAGEILPPRKELLKLRREPNGKTTAAPNHWHRQTIARSNPREFEAELSRLKGELGSMRAEVFSVDRSSPTVVDIVYLIEDTRHTQRIKADVRSGRCPEPRELGELSPTC